MSTASLGLTFVAAAHGVAGIAVMFHWARTDPGVGVLIRLDSEGMLWVRQANQDTLAEAHFVSAPLVVLVARAAVVPIWRDVLPRDVYRRVSVAARWPRRMAVVPPDGFEAVN